MKLELKSIKHYERLSEETNCFTAVLYVDGKRLCDVKNTGHGGSTDYLLIDVKNKQLLKDVEQYCTTLPEIEMFGKFFKQDLESVIDELLEEHLRGKDAKKLDKKMNAGLLFEHPQGYQIVSWTGKLINDMLKTPEGIVKIKQTIKRYADNNQRLINTNIPKEILDNLDKL